MALVPEIKLIRTDTTLDLSQKAEKVCKKSLIRCGLWAKNRNVELWNGLFWQIRVE